jgi:hypothetical protein
MNTCNTKNVVISRLNKVTNKNVDNSVNNSKKINKKPIVLRVFMVLNINYTSIFY